MYTLSKNIVLHNNDCTFQDTKNIFVCDLSKFFSRYFLHKYLYIQGGKEIRNENKHAYIIAELTETVWL